MTGTAEGTRTLTPKGEATRNRIIAAAAELFYENGVQRTGNETIRRTAHISGSQLNHYFPDREALVKAVLDRRVHDAMDPQRFPDVGMPDSLADLRRWADIYIKRYQTLNGGCRVGSLVGEVLKSGMNVQQDVADGFAKWADTLQAGLETMKTAGELVETADTRYLSLMLLSSLEGGLLLTQALGTTEPLEAALRGALEVVAGFSQPA